MLMLLLKNFESLLGSVKVVKWQGDGLRLLFERGSGGGLR
jgi:hypothetical protein